MNIPLEQIAAWLRWRSRRKREIALRSRKHCPAVATLGKPITEACGACNHCDYARRKDVEADECERIEREVSERAARPEHDENDELAKRIRNARPDEDA